jgi:hypothetical protein
VKVRFGSRLAQGPACNALAVGLIKQRLVGDIRQCFAHDDDIRWVPVLTPEARRESNHPFYFYP